MKFITQKYILVLLLFFSLFLIVSCKEKPAKKTLDHYVETEETTCPYGPDSTNQWNYENQSNWQHICPGSKCSGGDQSPIQIVMDSTTRDESLKVIFDWRNYNVKVRLKPYTLQAEYRDLLNFSGLDYITKTESKKYKLMQFHIHTPSEHKVKKLVNGNPVVNQSPIELHFVHVNESNEKDLLVVSVRYNGSGKPTDEADIALLKFATTKIDTKMKDYKVSHLLPSAKNFWKYDGSLTTPGCDTGITWIVMQSEVAVVQSTIDLLKQRYQNVPNNYNAREIQKNNSTVYSNN
jgi:carbonic anhydrase